MTPNRDMADGSPSEAAEPTPPEGGGSTTDRGGEFSERLIAWIGRTIRGFFAWVRRFTRECIRAWGFIDGDQRVAAVGCGLLIVSTFGNFSFVEAAVVIVALGVLVLLKKRGDGRSFHLPFGDGAVIMAAGAWSALLIVIRLFDRPLGPEPARARMRGDPVRGRPADTRAAADRRSAAGAGAGRRGRHRDRSGAAGRGRTGGHRGTRARSRAACIAAQPAAAPARRRRCCRASPSSGRCGARTRRPRCRATCRRPRPLTRRLPTTPHPACRARRRRLTMPRRACRRTRPRAARPPRRAHCARARRRRRRSRRPAASAAGPRPRAGARRRSTCRRPRRRRASPPRRRRRPIPTSTSAPSRERHHPRHRRRVRRRPSRRPSPARSGRGGRSRRMRRRRRGASRRPSGSGGT